MRWLMVSQFILVYLPSKESILVDGLTICISSCCSPMRGVYFSIPLMLACPRDLMDQ